MASPPHSARSPPGPSSTPVSQKRPGGLSLALPKSRKPSLAPSTGSAHPLRQTSFPPTAEDEKHLRFSPGEDDLDDGDLDSEINSAINGPADGSLKRKRGEKRMRGRPGMKGINSRKGSVSLIGGEDGRKKGARSTAGAPSVVTGGGSQPDAEDSDDDHEDNDGLGARGEAFTMDPAELDRDNQRRYLFREAVPTEHQERYDTYNKVKLRTADVRRLVNATLSQSVPQNVVTVVGAYTKMFAGMLIESAREVQAEWMAVQPLRPDGEPQQAYKRLKLMTGREELEESDRAAHDEERQASSAPEKAKAEDDEMDVEASRGLKKEPTSPTSKVAEIPEATPSASQPNGLPNGTQTTEAMSTPEKHKKKDDADEDELPDDFANVQPGAWGLSRAVEECDRGPLQPDHFREALRRYKKARNGGTVGFTGISLYGMENRDVAASRMGGRKLFR
ncbi:hypothetical protein CKM354_001085800 [Cercospora kikuchii]|uniref:TAFII28-like protein domain-containing protein n=1 Tax=Cercospora kikuchii TaxID=84275 RepID=A0A9P3FL14_9PEZI|nr:uncharacterized protein CKM354_001085800 [Cercospora kikuchii]GIZ47775.1 hypothetical protein CKM354_001085800 [Cercospora kikuchii]